MLVSILNAGIAIMIMLNKLMIYEFKCANYFEDENRNWEQYVSDKNIETSPTITNVTITMRDD